MGFTYLLRLYMNKIHCFKNVIIITALISFSLPSFSQSLITQYNPTLITAAAVLAKGKPLSRTQSKRLVSVTKNRNNAMVKALQTNSSLAYSLILPPDILINLPHVVKPYLEREIKDVKGVFEIRAAFYPNAKENSNGKDILQFFLKQKDDHYFQLHFVGTIPTDITGGSEITIKRALLIPDTGKMDHLLIRNQDIQTKRVDHVNAIPASFGPQRTIVMMVNFQNAPNTRPWSLNQVGDMVFNQLNNFYYELSYRQTTVTGIVVGYYTIPLNQNQTCDSTWVNQVASLATDAARRAGVDLSPYRRRVYMFPGNPTCGWGGVANIAPDQVTNAWINGYNDLSLIGHEVGHNIGLYHANFLRCSGNVNTSNCSNVEYGDLTDVMGISGTGHFNAFHKDQLGWLNYQNSPPIRTVTTSGTYPIDAMETFNSNVKALKILKRVQANGSRDYYYLEYRSGAGYDSQLGSCRDCDVTRGIIFHQGNDRNSDSSHLLDMSPTDNNSKMVALLPGQSFTDASAANGGVTFTVISAGNGAASVRVTFGSNPPNPPPPPNQSYTYNVILGYPFAPVTINQSIRCPTTTGGTTCPVRQIVGKNIVITGNNQHICNFTVQSNGSLVSMDPSNYCYVDLRPASTTMAGIITLPSQF